ncbi:baseplate J/gp47 family protein [Sphingomonas sp. 10B4]|uniref:baseplate J/gp47 family protein n=1 Tax=Sphingomonas sp. 10B4 TaxID=3048575 RepID=UPI002AB3BAF7|nr:baseplate J/gp47 family protein [Sphingomonas sp. 10B4]MDY7525478.1 baseplate J/gp47 family protein [Sphingomonas sp. 10B4]MEB0281422.1 baseplate J/gp47 family protein [Sphingomonas sp. 10B4]
MALQTKTFAQVVQDQATATQGGSTRYLADFSVGSILRAVIEASAATVMWLQGLILQLLATTRAATAAGADLDSWMADYALTRLGAVAATGVVTFARFTATLNATVPVGALIQTTDGTQTYRVIIDTTNAAYNAVAGGYVLTAGTASTSVPVASASAGSSGNAAVGAINTLGQAISGIDTVSNATAFTNGLDAETDAAFRVRFIAYIASLSKATKGAVGYAITTLQAGLTYTLTENYTYAGVYQPGYFYVVIDDGSGAPSSGLISTVSSAIDAVRPLTSSFGVFAPVVVTAGIAATITTGAGYSHAVVAATLQTALAAYVNALPLGVSLAWSRLFQVAYDASPGVTEVTLLTVNGAMVDLPATPQQAIIAGSVIVS